MGAGAGRGGAARAGGAGAKERMGEADLR